MPDQGCGGREVPQRPTLTVAEVYALADAMPERFRLLVLLATFCSLRWGELAALTRDAVDEERGLIHVRSTLTEMSDGQLIVGPPKTAAGRRVVAVPPGLLHELRTHLAGLVACETKGLIFAGPRGAALRRSNFQKQWTRALAVSGLDDRGLHFHDLRHTGNTFTAQSGATLADLMARMGHASTRAASIYLHTTSDRDLAVAAALDRLLPPPRSGT